MMHIGVIAGCGKGVGFGHIMRTLVLANVLKAVYGKDSTIVYLLPEKKHCPNETDLIHNAGFKVYHANQPQNMLHPNQWEYIPNDVLIVDSYCVNDESLMQFSHLARCVMYIDDNNLLNYFDVDLLLNQNAHAKSLSYNTRAKVLAGTQYLLLREEFTTAQPVACPPEINDVLITTGGADPHGAALKVLQAFMDDKLTCHVVVGANAPTKDALIHLAKLNNHIVLHHAPSMAKLMRQCQIAVSACGITMYELAAMGVPTIGIIAADNQLQAAKAMAHQGAIALAGAVDSAITERVLALYQQLAGSFKKRQEMQLHQLRVVGRNGAILVANTIRDLL